MVYLFALWIGSVAAVIVNDQPVDYTDSTLVEHTNKLTGDKYMAHRHNLYIDAGIYEDLDRKAARVKFDEAG